MVKITKSHARTLYNAGHEVMILPNKMRTDSFMASWTSKPADDQYTYMFVGWEPEITAVTGDATYQAIFTPE